MADPKADPRASPPPLTFARWTSAIDASFWAALRDAKLDRWRLDDAPRPLVGYLRPPTGGSSGSGFQLEVRDASLSPGSAGAAPRADELAVRGLLVLANTAEAFRALDKVALLQACVAPLTLPHRGGGGGGGAAFVLALHSDFKAFAHVYWFGFPALVSLTAASGAAAVSGRLEAGDIGVPLVLSRERMLHLAAAAGSDAGGGATPAIGAADPVAWMRGRAGGSVPVESTESRLAALWASPNRYLHVIAAAAASTRPAVPSGAGVLVAEAGVIDAGPGSSSGSSGGHGGGDGAGMTLTPFADWMAAATAATPHASTAAVGGAVSGLDSPSHGSGEPASAAPASALQPLLPLAAGAGHAGPGLPLRRPVLVALAPHPAGSRSRVGGTSAGAADDTATAVADWGLRNVLAWVATSPAAAALLGGGADTEGAAQSRRLSLLLLRPTLTGLHEAARLASAAGSGGGMVAAGASAPAPASAGAGAGAADAVDAALAAAALADDASVLLEVALTPARLSSLVLPPHAAAPMLGPAAWPAHIVLPAGTDGGAATTAALSAVGWEPNHRGQLAPRSVNLRASMDPVAVADAAATLNLQLMRWRMLPELNLPRIAATRCLLLGAGTLGCHVARDLLAWGFRSVTLVDAGRVAVSNPTRQPLFELADATAEGGMGRGKAEAAAAALRRIHPAMDAVGETLTIPMPGHPLPSAPAERARVGEAVARLDALIAGHDAVFLLTDTRESRWLPTLLARRHRRVAITIALAFDSFLAMRHGVDASGEGGIGAMPAAGGRLGCYFCNDVVAPTDSTSNRTLDQQCTVTRPGCAPMAAAVGVELLVAMLHHPAGAAAPAEAAAELTARTSTPLGLLPHQVRGFISHYTHLLVATPAFPHCPACSDSVLAAYGEGASGGFAFVSRVCESAAVLEDDEVTGLRAMRAAMEAAVTRHGVEAAAAGDGGASDGDGEWADLLG